MFVAHRRKQADEVSRVIIGAESHDILTTSLAVEVDELLRRCHEVDERMLGKSVAIFIREYESAKDFDNRPQALMNAMELLDKLMRRLSPWYVRYEKALAIAISLLGVIPGILEIIRGAKQLAN